MGLWRLKVGQGRAYGEPKVGPSLPNLPKLAMPRSVDLADVIHWCL